MPNMFTNNILNIEDLKLDKSTFNKYIKPYKGTTTLAFIFQGGMVIAVDSRATSGSYIASQSVHKVIRINKYLVGTMAGGAADCYYWEKRMGLYAKSFELKNNRRISVSAASMFLSNCIYNYKGKGLSMGTMVCGYDENTPVIYYVDDAGQRLSGNIFSVGSGSLIAYGVLNDLYKFDMSKDEALELGKRAIFHAASTDAYSGGSVNLYFMDKDGWEHVGCYDVDSFSK